MNHEESLLQQACVSWFRAQYPQYAMLLVHPINEGSGHTSMDRRRQGIRNPKGMIWHIEQTVMPDGVLNKQEEYLFLVYRVRKLTIYYRNNSQKEEDKRVLLEHVRKLDKWNKEITKWVEAHPQYKPKDSKSHSFYVVVNEWRKTYYERQRYGKQLNCDQNVFREMTRKIRGFEKEIDKYIKQHLELI